MRPAPARLPVLRRPPRRLVLTAVLALACGLLVLRATDRAEARSARYGDPVVTWVVQRPLEPGARIEPGAVAAEARPLAFVPEGAAVDDPTGRQVTVALATGEVVAEHRLADGDRRGAAALVPEGWRAVAVPAIDAALPVEVGHRVDVLASTDADARGAVGTVVAEGGVVVHVAEDGTITVAVPGPDAPRVVAAMTGGYVALALTG